MCPKELFCLKCFKLSKEIEHYTICSSDTRKKKTAQLLDENANTAFIILLQGHIRTLFKHIRDNI